MKRRGMTLVEILTAVVVFGLFFTIACTTLVRCYSNYIANRDITTAFRDTSTGFDRMFGELQQCQQIYSPDPTGGVFSEGQTMSPTVATPFVFAFQRPDVALGGLNGNPPLPPLKAVGYRLNQNVLERLVYAQGADPTASAPIAIQTVANPVATFTITHLARGNEFDTATLVANATVQAKARKLPVFFQVRVLAMKAGL